MKRNVREFREAILGAEVQSRSALSAVLDARKAESEGAISQALVLLGAAATHLGQGSFCVDFGTQRLRGRRDKRAKKAPGHGIEKNPIEPKLGRPDVAERIIMGRSPFEASVFKQLEKRTPQQSEEERA